MGKDLQGLRESTPRQGLAIVGMLLALVGGMAAIIRPLEDRVRSLEQEVKEYRRKIDTHVQDGHPKAVREVIDSRAQLFQKQIDQIKANLSVRYSQEDDAQNERLRALERVIYKQQ